MAKEGGGTRNYNPGSRAWTRRLDEYNGLLATGLYDESRSEFDNSGGFYITHKEHDLISNTKEDKSDLAVQFLAAKGYRVYLDSEKTTISDNGKKRDGRIEKLTMDIKTINEAGSNTIKGAIERAVKQNVRCVILYQNTEKMDKEYVIGQIYGDEGFLKKSPRRAVEQIDWVIVVGSNGHIHRHALYKHRQKKSAASKPL